MSTKGMQRTLEPHHAIMAAHRALAKSMARNLAKDGLSLPQFGVIRVIAKMGPMPMRRLSQEMLVSPPNITGIIDRLAKRGLVKRMANIKDRRTFTIELTEEGGNLYEAITKRQNAFLQETLKILAPDEQKILSALLLKLRNEIVRRENFDH